MRERALEPTRDAPTPRIGAAPVAMLVAFAMLVPFPEELAVAQGGAQDRPSALGAATIAGPAPRLEVPGVVIGAPASETTLGIALGRGGELPANSFVRIRGLSPEMSLTAGHVIAPGAWAVPVAALADLRVVIPDSAAGRSEVSIALVAIDGGVVAEARTTLVVAAAALGQKMPAAKPAVAAPVPADDQPPRTLVPRAAPPPAPKDAISGEPAAAPPRPAEPATAALPPVETSKSAALPAAPRASAPEPQPQPPVLTPAARERSEGFLARGRKLLDTGDFASARLLFRRAADDGLAAGALALATTFDPAEIDRLHAVGIRPDTAEARRWYEKARELGAGPAADRHLERLGSR